MGANTWPFTENGIVFMWTINDFVSINVNLNDTDTPGAWLLQLTGNVLLNPTGVIPYFSFINIDPVSKSTPG